ncbi:MAG: hypothetical protein WBW44_03065, partial [Solirubrobacterales bacterium]
MAGLALTQTTWRTNFAVAVALLLPVLAFGSPAWAAEGDIAFDSCVTATSETAQKPSGTVCSDQSPSFTSLNQPVAIATADNGSVYVTGTTNQAITQLAPDELTGELEALSCVEGSPTGGVTGCDDLGTTAYILSNPAGIATVGDDIYVADYGSDSVVHLAADGDGELSLEDCLTVDATKTDCTNVSGSTNALDAVSSIAASPDGENIYVGSSNTSSVVNLSRAEDGSLSFTDCLTGGQFSGSTTGCTDISDDDRSISPGRIAVDPGGSFVYITGVNPLDTVAQLTRATNGTLAFDLCLSGPSSALGCDSTTAQTNALDGPAGLVAAEGGHIYISSIYSDSIVHLARDGNGELEISDCVTSEPSTTFCDDISDAPESTNSLDFARSVQLSQTGEYVLVAAPLSDSVASFSRNPSGSLNFTDCVTSNAATTGCSEDISTDTNVLDSLGDIAIAPDGAAVYGIGNNPDMAVKFSREPDLVPETTITSGPTGSTEDTTPTFAFESDLAGGTFTCSTDGGTPFACTSPLTLGTLPVGGHTFSVFATKVTGTPDPTPAEASFEVVEPTLPPVEPPTEPPTQPPADTDSPRLTLKAKKR